MTLTVGITLVAVAMAAITAIIAVVQQLHIQSLTSEKKDLKQSLLTSHKHHANEREVSAKLEADLKQADIEFDLLSKDSAQWKTLLNESLDDYVKLEHQYTDLIAMPRRKRELAIKEIKANLAK